MHYRIAETSDDYKHCADLLKAVGQPAQELAFPTVMAINETGLIGFLATSPRTDMVLAGPLIMRQDKRRVMTALRLVTMYEMALRNIGITSFIFWVDENDGIFFKAMERYFPNVKPYAKSGSRIFYTWHIDEIRKAM
jgi:hypothetical protein